MNDNLTRLDGSHTLLDTLQSIVTRRWKLLLLCLVGVLAPIIYYNWTTSPIYEAKAKVMFDELNDPLAFDRYDLSREILLLNNIEEIKSHSLAEDIVEALPEGLLARFPLPPDLPPHVDRRDKIASMIDNSITASVVRNSSMVKIRVRMTDPHLCMVVANLVPEVLQARSIRVRQEGATGIRQFVVSQVDQYTQRLDESEQALRRYKQRHRITSFDSESEEMLKRVTQVEVRYNSAIAERRAAEERLSSMEAKGSARKNELVQLQVEIESLRAEEEALLGILTGYQESLAQLPEKEFQLARLTRDRDVNQKILTMLLEKREEFRISEAEKLPTIRVIDKATPPTRPISPRRYLNIALGLMLGLAVGIGFGFVLENIQGGLRSTRELEQLTGWPVLATIPRIGRSKTRHMPRRSSSGKGVPKDGRARRALHTLLDPHSPASESYLMLRTHLENLGIGARYKSLMVTSIGPGEGKSSTLANLAITFAKAGRSTLLVDAEFRRPMIHSFFDIYKTPGLGDLLVDHAGNGGGDGSAQAQRPEVNGSADSITYQTTPVDNLTILASGKRPRAETLALYRPRMTSFLEDAGTKYGVTLIDSAPLTLVHDTVILSTLVDAVLFVVDATNFDADRVVEAKNLLERADATVIGAVVNRSERQGMHAYYYNMD